MTNLKSVDAGEAGDIDLPAARLDLERLVQRLRQLSPGAWRVRRAPAMALLDQLSEWGAAESNWPRTTVPALPDHALADALTVVGGDLLDEIATTGRAVPAALGRSLGECLDATR